MSHELEFVDGQACIAYAGEVPWHGLGHKVSNDLTPAQMAEAAQVNWTVGTVPLFADINGKQVDTGHAALVRESDSKVLDVITNDWHPTQNSEAFEFFNDFVAAGEMSMEVAGSLKGGTIVWALAKTNEAFELFGGRDVVESYLLFTNPHQYGRSIDIRTTMTRVVCNNTITAALQGNSKNVVKVSHRRKFDGDEVKQTLGVANDRLLQYKEIAKYLSERRYTGEDIVEYFTRIFPLPDTSEKEMSKNANLAIEKYMTEQPGAELGEGTWWQAFNAVTYLTNHVIGRSNDARLQSTWYGANSSLNNSALKLAAEYASA